MSFSVGVASMNLNDLTIQTSPSWNGSVMGEAEYLLSSPLSNDGFSPLPSPQMSPELPLRKIESTQTKSSNKKVSSAEILQPGTFEMENHLFDPVKDAILHPTVAAFFALSHETIASRYCAIHPNVNRDALLKLIRADPQYFKWAGTDLFHVSNSNGQRSMIVVETNSCPAGNDSLPQSHTKFQEDGYHTLLRNAFVPQVQDAMKAGELPLGGKLAVVYDKNHLECSGYAGAMANLFHEKVYLVKFSKDDKDAPAKFINEVLYVRDENHDWQPIRAAFRYVTAAPWNRLPVQRLPIVDGVKPVRTLILNPIISCLAGGRNKLVASIAYNQYNTTLDGTGLRLRTPHTIPGVVKADLPAMVAQFGGKAVIKVPYSNAGQGVYTICTEAELKAFMAEPIHYEQYIVQQLIGDYNWASTLEKDGTTFHVGTMPDENTQKRYVSDLRMMVVSGPNGFKPLSLYARKAASPLTSSIDSAMDSWAQLGTNLSFQHTDGTWDTDLTRLVLADTKTFDELGLGLDELIDGFIQSVLATLAIDEMAKQLLGPNQTFDFKTYAAFNADQGLLNEIV